MENLPNSDPPLDDYGIHNDHILDICESLIKQLWQKITIDNQNLSVREIKDAAETVNYIWNLVQSIIEIDEQINGEENFPPEEEPPSH